MSEGAATPPVPRLAATLLVVRDDPFEVLMVRRNDRGQFASALVFPGGVVEPQDRDEAWLAHVDGAEGLDADERALRIAAIRETFEETAVLVAEDCRPLGDVTGLLFLEIVRSHGLRLKLDGIVPFAHWVTPERAPKRFDTHFYVARAVSDGVAVCDGAETVALEWAAPAAIIARAQAGERSILFPTLSNLRRLAESDDTATALEAARRRPHFTVHPRPEPAEGGTIIRIPAEAGYTETRHFYPRAG
jgi:8-oxo-dGTP pyrophosphatase MutT (NUDIX family)